MKGQMTSRPMRGVLSVRADANPTAVLAQLQAAFEEFKITHTTQIKGVEAKFDDVVTRDKLDKVSADVLSLQSALDTAMAKIAAGGAGGNGARVKDPEYTKAFSQHIRKGEVQASLNKGTAAEGGYVAPIEWDRTITDKLILVSPMRSIARVQQISTAGFSKLFNLRGTVSGWVGENAARPETGTPTMGSMNYLLGEIYANPFATQQLLDDALIDLESWLAAEVQTEFAFQENVAFISGTGANNRPNGILTYVTGGANAAVHPFGAITTVNSGAAATLTADGIVRLVHALPSAFTPNARFAMNRNTQRDAMLLKDTTNQYLWQPSYQAGMPSTLNGYPLVEMPAMPDLAAASKSVLFGDFDQSYLIVDGIGSRILRDPFSSKPYISFYTTKRVGGGLLNPEAMKALNTSV